MYKIKKGSTVLVGCTKREDYVEFINKYNTMFQIKAIYDDQCVLTDEKIEQVPVYKEETLSFGYDNIIVVGDNWKYTVNRLFSRGFLPFRDFVTAWVLELYLNSSVLSYSKLKEYISKKRNQCIADYIRFVSYDKKIALVYGNCQIPFLVRFLSRTTEFIREYTLLSVPPIHTLRDEKENGFDSGMLKMVQLFIYQNIKQDNKFSKKLASDTIINFIGINCKKVSIPNVFFKGYFPQLGPNPNNPCIGSKYNAEGLFPYGDENIRSMLAAGMDASQILKHISAKDFYHQDDVKRKAELSIQELKEREQKCDVKISDFIEQHYKEHRLFYVPNHPTNFVIKELACRILSYLGYKNCTMNIKNIPENDNLEVPIYPSVARALDLKFNTKYTCFCRAYDSNPVDLEGYVTAYEKYCKE